MASDSHSYTLDISEALFKLTTESLRLHSDETKRYQTLGSFLDVTMAGGRDPLDDHTAQTVREHLSVIPTNGNIRIHVRVATLSAGRLTEMKHRLAQALGSTLTIGDALSVVLFHYVAGQHATRVFERLGLGANRKKDGRAQRADGSETPTNVFRLK